MLVARNAEGELLKIPVPMHYLYVFVAGALIGMLTITGMLGSYTRMAVKAQRYNQLRDEQKALKSQYSQLEQIAQENELQAQSLSSLAGEVSSLYGLKPDPAFQDDDPASASLQQFYALRMTAMTGAASVGIGMGEVRDTSTRDWMRLAAAPTLWPVQGRITGSFGERIDPFSGEGAFHRGVDISSDYRHSHYCSGRRHCSLLRFYERLRPRGDDRPWQRHQHAVWPSFRVCGERRDS